MDSVYGFVIEDAESLVESARVATEELPQDPSWVLPVAVPRYDRALSIFPVGFGCRNPSVTRFDVMCFYADWGSVGLAEKMCHQAQHMPGTAEKCEAWLEEAGFEGRLDRVWHTNVLLALRNAKYDPHRKSETGDHRMYRCYRLMQASAAINARVERATGPRLYMTLGISAAVAFCHTHPGGDPERRFESYQRHNNLRHATFTLETLYRHPYPLADGSIVVQLCHPAFSHISGPARWKSTPGRCDIELLREGLKLAGLL